MVVFFVESDENTYPKGRAHMQMYRVVPITKKRELHKETDRNLPLSVLGFESFCKCYC